jgi:L-seryl-tRNA(Ser) seleniumtransferase
MPEQSTEGQLSRRRFLSLSSAAAATLGIAPLVGNATESFAEDGTSPDDYYAKLGVEKIINAAGTYTFLTAACMPPQVQRAVAQAALHPVRLRDLQLAAGEYLAKKLRCEAGYFRSIGRPYACNCGLRCLGEWREPAGDSGKCGQNEE